MSGTILPSKPQCFTHQEPHLRSCKGKTSNIIRCIAAPVHANPTQQQPASAATVTCPVPYRRCTLLGSGSLTRGSARLNLSTTNPTRDCHMHGSSCWCTGHQDAVGAHVLRQWATCGTACSQEAQPACYTEVDTPHTCCALSRAAIERRAALATARKLICTQCTCCNGSVPCPPS